MLQKSTRGTEATPANVGQPVTGQDKLIPLCWLGFEDVSCNVLLTQNRKKGEER